MTVKILDKYFNYLKKIEKIINLSKKMFLRKTVGILFLKENGPASIFYDMIAIKVILLISNTIFFF